MQSRIGIGRHGAVITVDQVSGIAGLEVYHISFVISSDNVQLAALSFVLPTLNRIPYLILPLGYYFQCVHSGISYWWYEKATSPVTRLMAEFEALKNPP
ncbi:hypothetical protein [Serratia fonticola]|uniref:hypothetical protein n=1 Tax=Serratia fonticola TaxID=47917 RepID=UPI00192D14A1|nr:hypothetical protein [Serratia fonticola]MBL5825410.1 hypothetical protein [Serratia fonticola]